jgi:hypothetical protein
MFGHCLYSRRSLRHVLAVVLLASLLQNLHAASTLTVPGGLVVALKAAGGTYQVSCLNPAWSFSGSLAAPLKHVVVTKTHDGIGPGRQISFEWRAGNLPMRGQIRVYQGKALALFSQTCLAAVELPPAAFPAFTEFPATLHVFSYGHHEFAPPHFSVNEICTPWMLFDDHANALIISPASHFMVASMLGNGTNLVASGFNSSFRNLPAGFTQQTLVACAPGINRTWSLWGRALVDLQGAARPAYDADTVLKYLGYWTDNGAGYYYNYDFDKGYTGTLQYLVDRYRQEQIPIRYLQLDSWWYYKTTTAADGQPGKDRKSDRLPAGEWNRYGGLLEYRAHTNLFPHGLDAFQKAVGLPLVTHSRWIDPASPYHEHYKISGIAAVDPKWWNHIAGYLKTSGIVTYEQDWLDRIYTYSPAFSSDLGTAEAFLDNMSRACQEQGVTLQYCMPYPCYFLQGSRYENLTSIRTSGDRFNTNKWNDFLYTSRLASALGIWPWTDVSMSPETDNVLLSTLSAGPVGTGDLLGAEDKENLLQAVRADGVIVKPDAAIVPLDQCYIADADKQPGPLAASTYTDHDGIKTEYLFAFNRPKTLADNVHFTLGEMDLKGPAYVYDYFGGTGQKLAAGTGFSAPLAAGASAFYVIAPVGQSGIAFLGDKHKFVGTGKQRITSLCDEAGKLTIGLTLATNEPEVTLHGYASAKPTVTVLAAEDDDVQYDPATHYFTVVIKSDASAPISRSGGDSVRQAKVILEVAR